MALQKLKDFTTKLQKQYNSFQKPLTYETIWDGARCPGRVCTYAEAEAGAPDGYRLPTLEEAELFCKLYDVSYKDKELKLKTNNGTVFTAKISDKNSYAYVTYRIKCIYGLILSL